MLPVGLGLGLGRASAVIAMKAVVRISAMLVRRGEMVLEERVGFGACVEGLGPVFFSACDVERLWICGFLRIDVEGLYCVA